MIGTIIADTNTFYAELFKFKIINFNIIIVCLRLKLNVDFFPLISNWNL